MDIYTTEQTAVNSRVALSASLTEAKRNGGRVSLSDLISARKAEKQAKAEVAKVERAKAKEKAAKKAEDDKIRAAFAEAGVKIPHGYANVGPLSDVEDKGEEGVWLEIDFGHRYWIPEKADMVNVEGTIYEPCIEGQVS